MDTAVRAQNAKFLVWVEVNLPKKQLNTGIGEQQDQTDLLKIAHSVEPSQRFMTGATSKERKGLSSNVYAVIPDRCY